MCAYSLVVAYDLFWSLKSAPRKNINAISSFLRPIGNRTPIATSIFLLPCSSLGAWYQLNIIMISGSFVYCINCDYSQVTQLSYNCFYCKRQ